ncbi:MAG: protein-export chaperone SecB, partial [Burkholderiales bacterium]
MSAASRSWRRSTTRAGWTGCCAASRPQPEGTRTMSEQQPIFNIDRIYLKDLSLEIPNAPQVYAERESPKIDINLHNEARALDPG